MNVKIKELAEQAKLPGYVLEYGTELCLVPHLEKFAELIVRECIARCDFVANMATITNSGEMARKTKATANNCSQQIKQHFGVE